MTEFSQEVTTLEAENGHVRVVVRMDEAMNYALAHNGISPLQLIEVENRSERSIDDLNLELRVAGPVTGKIADPLRARLPEIGPNRSIAVRNARQKWLPDVQTFASLDEAETGAVTMHASYSGGHLEAAAQIRLLARDEWWAVTIPESLAAFVTPRARAIRDLLGDASELLGSRTGDPSIQGYQGGTERALAIAESIYDAMAAKEIRYIDPPPSFEGTGQKIRPPHEVLVERWGTCLDLATTYAGALEAAGLNSVLVLCHGHAFAGHLLDDNQLPERVTREPEMIQNFVDSGAFVPTETVSLCQGNKKSFREASGRPSSDGWWSSRIGEVQGLIDVRSAHRVIKPIPAIHVEDGVRVVEVERGPAPVAPSFVAAAKGQKDPKPAPRGGSRPSQVTYPPRVARWRNSLLDLSFRNPLLNMRTGSGALDLHVPKGALGGLEDMVFDGTEITILPQDQLADIHLHQGARTAQDIAPEELTALLLEERTVFGACTEAKYVSRLRGLHRRAKTVFEETGANNLFLALGVLNWEDAGRKARAPLFLMPVKLKARRGRPFHLAIEEGGYTQPNQCLLEKLRVSKGLTIPQFQDPDSDDSGIDLAGSLQAIRLALIDAELSYSIDESAHLALLQFSTLQLWRDLSDNWEVFLQNPVVRHLVETPTDTFVDPAGQGALDVGAAEAAAYCPVSVDGSQLEAVAWAESGRSFVLEGPPGTGKSQTITNLIANALAKGQKVLFVAEKQAALDVVRRRLRAIGLDDLCLDLHGKSQSPEKMRAQLRAALQHPAAGNEQSWKAVWAQHVSAVEMLRRYPAALHQDSDSAMSLWDARQSLLANGDGPVAAISHQTVGSDFDADGAFSLGRDLTEALYALGSSLDEHPWRLATPAALATEDSRAGLSESIAQMQAALAAVASPALGLLELSPSTGVVRVARWLELAEAAFRIPSATELRKASTSEVEVQLAEAARSLDALEADGASFMQTFVPAVFDADLDQLLIKSKAADAKLFKGRARKAVAAELAPHLRDVATVDVGTLTPTLEALIGLRSRGRELAAQLSALPAIGVDYMALEPESTERVRAQLALAAGSRDLFELIANPDAAIDAIGSAGLSPGSRGTVEAVASSWADLANRVGASADEVATWCGDEPLLTMLRRSLPGWEKDSEGLGFVQLGRWLAVKTALDDLRARGFEQLPAQIQTGVIRPDDVEAALRRGVASAVVRRGLESPMLAGFDGVRRNRDIAEFDRACQELRESMKTELPAQIIAQRPFSSERLVGKVGELNRELSRKRGGLKIRELFANYGSIVGQLTPCLMMSPHSVARFLPADALTFDLVVFDEASQIKVAESIGAMGRAKAAVVVGDSQQMPPSSAFGAGTDEDEEQVVGIPVDMESVLSEAVESNLPRVWLSWHYRSKHEGLITFSNVHYYEGRLASFPRPPGEGAASGFGVSLRPVGGQWERGKAQVNRAEAEAIVAGVGRRLGEGDPRSIGIVTLNSSQQSLILDMLEESDDEQIAAALQHPSEPLFVKNLENVQGDERDVILFSLAFSPDPETDRMALNFGPLTHAGGERRLNVAVTRARSQVVLFSSFEPRHIDLNRTSSVGLAHLRAYMEMAVREDDEVVALRAAQARDRHRDEIVEALREQGLEVRTDVGQSDFRVDIGVATNPSGPWVAVFLDGPAYAGRKTVGDREVLPPSVLVGAMGWSGSARIWLPDWLRDRDEAIARVIEAVNDAAQPAASAQDVRAEGIGTESGEGRSADVEPDEDEQAAPDGTVESQTPAAGIQPGEPALLRGSEPSAAPSSSPQRQAGFTSYTEAHAELVGGVEILDGLGVHPSHDRAVKAQIDDVIGGEAPIEASRLARIVARRFDLRRVAASRAARILALVPADQRFQSPLGDFVWPAAVDPTRYEDFRVPADGESRTIEEIPPEEVINAMVYLAEVGGGISSEELIRESAGLFGARRITAGIRSRLESILEVALSNGKLERDGEFVVPPASG